MTEITGNTGNHGKSACGQCGDEEKRLRLVAEMTREYYDKGRALVQVLYIAR